MLSMIIDPAAFAPGFPCAVALGISEAMEKTASSGASADGGDLALLLPSIAAGDRSALATLYRRTSAKLYGVAVRILADEGAAEEVLQDVFVTVWNKAAAFEVGRASPITWLAVLTRNRAIDRKRRLAIPTVPINLAAEVAGDAPLASEIAEQREEAGRLHHCLEELDERARSLIRDAFLGGLSYPELAQRETVPLGTMKSWIRRGLQKLKGCLER